MLIRDGVDLGDAERVADRRVRRRAAALAQDALRARERDDVVDGEEIGLVLQFGDQRELVLDQLADLRVQRDAAIPSRQAFLGELAQMRCGRLAFRHDLLRVFVAQLVQRERAALRDRDRFREQRRRVDRRKTRARAQVPLAVRVQREAAFGERLLHADRGERVLQRAPRADVHVDVARGDPRQSGHARERLGAREPDTVAGAGEELDGEPRAAGKSGCDPAGGGERLGVVGLALAQRGFRGHPQREQPVGERRDVVAAKRVAALRRVAPAAGDQLRQVAVARAIGDEQHDLHAVDERHLAADHERQAGFLRRKMRADDTGERAFVGDRERRIAQRLRPVNELVRMRRAAQEREVRQAVELGVRGEHGAAEKA